jgi:hypothetical protein
VRVGGCNVPSPHNHPFSHISFKDDVTVILLFCVSFIGRKGKKVKREERREEEEVCCVLNGGTYVPIPGV